MEDGQPVPYSLYIYVPNDVAPVIFTVAYFASAVGHAWQCHLYKTWKTYWLHPLAGVLFTLGYAFREYGAFHYSYTDQTALILYVLSQIFIFICPPLLELANYHVLGHTLAYIPRLSPFPPHLVFNSFGLICFVVEAINAIGVALNANPTSKQSTVKLGSNLILASLGLQLAVISSCYVLAGTFQHRIRAARLPATRQVRGVHTMLVVLYASMTLILARCVYRLVEHTGTTTIDLKNPEELRNLTPVLRYEWYFYVFEATLMLLNSLLWNVWHPGRFLPRDKRVTLAADGVTEVGPEETGPEGGKDGSDPRTAWQKLVSWGTFGFVYGKKEIVGKQSSHMELGGGVGSQGTDRVHLVQPAGQWKP